MEIRPQYAISVSQQQAAELQELYRQAANRLSAESVLGWLETQPPHRIVSQPGNALGCLLATYLMTVTTQMWFIGETTFWHFSLSRHLEWTLPAWAVHYMRLERAATHTLTVDECRILVRRAQRQGQSGLLFAQDVEYHEVDAGNNHFSVESSA